MAVLDWSPINRTPRPDPCKASAAREDAARPPVVSSRPLSDEIRWLLSRVEYDTNGGCWLWAGSIGSYGYGRIERDGRQTGAHRRAWEVFRGPIPKGLILCHKCDVRACVNPDHIFLGTNKDNTADMWRKGRHPGRHPADTRSAVADLITLGETHAAIARATGVSATTVNTIKRELGIPAGRRNKLSASAAAEIRRLAGARSLSGLAKDFGVSKSAIRHIVAGRSWR